MGRISAALLVLAMICAMGVITSQNRARKVFVELEGEQAAQHKLDEEFTQLQLEQGTWATNKRIESIASKSLGMGLPEAANTVIVTLGARAAPGAKP